MNTAAPLLLVEDDPAIARSLREGLEREGYRVIHSATGTEGIVKAIVEAHVGSVRAANTSPRARFCITMPEAR